MVVDQVVQAWTALAVVVVVEALVTDQVVQAEVLLPRRLLEQVLKAAFQEVLGLSVVLARMARQVSTVSLLLEVVGYKVPAAAAGVVPSLP